MIRMTIRTNELAIQRTDEVGDPKGPEFVIPVVTTPFEARDSVPINAVAVNIEDGDDKARFLAAIRSVQQ